MLAQYVRDFLKDNKKKTLKDALYLWNLKKQRPTETGYIVMKKRTRSFPSAVHLYYVFLDSLLGLTGVNLLNFQDEDSILLTNMLYSDDRQGTG